MIQNSLIAGNSASQYSEVAGNLTSRDYNLIQDAPGIRSLRNTDLHPLSVSEIKIDPSLRLNGSTSTNTHALLPTSPAINVIPTKSCWVTIDGILITKDQRGVKRPQGALCDIGAYEYNGT